MNDLIIKPLPNIVALVPAAGSGARMSASVPKQYLRIGKKTILEHTVDRLLTHSAVSKVVIVISPNDDIFRSLTLSHHPNVEICLGGHTRAESVLAGLKKLDINDWVLVHDAARPCVNCYDISLLISTVLERQQGAILATKVTDTIKQVDPVDVHSHISISGTLDRRYLWAAATPQMFNVDELRKSISKALADQIEITDEASAIEYCGGSPLLVECRRDNIKVTQPEDLALAAFYLNWQEGKS